MNETTNFTQECPEAELIYESVKEIVNVLPEEFLLRKEIVSALLTLSCILAQQENVSSHEFIQTSVNLSNVFLS